MPVHYPQKFSGKYEAPAEEISRRLVGVIERAVDISGMLNAEAEKLTATSALVERHGGPADPSPLDIESFARHFGLTPAERRFCVSLFHGRTLLEAALEHGISHGSG